VQAVARAVEHLHVEPVQAVVSAVVGLAALSPVRHATDLGD